MCAETDGVDACEPVTLREIAWMQRFPYRVGSVISSGIGMLALAMTSIGLYGVIAFAVAQRTREIGTRMALGASRAAVLVSVLAQSAGRVAPGIVLGIPFCLIFSAMAAASFFLADTYDLRAYLGVPLFLSVVALAAAFIPARRATRIDPIAALRQE